MNKTELTQLLNLTYEMEGLTELALKRHPDTPDEIYNLIAEKAYMLANAAASARERSQHETPAPTTADLEAMIEEKKHREPENDDAVRELMADEDTVYLPTEEESVIDDMFEQEDTQRQPLKTFFSINDHYLYRRELFGKSDEDYRASMHLIENMKNLAEAEDYLVKDLQLDPENQYVEGFVEILKRYFNQN